MYTSHWCTEKAIWHPILIHILHQNNSPNIPLFLPKRIIYYRSYTCLASNFDLHQLSFPL